MNAQHVVKDTPEQGRCRTMFTKHERAFRYRALVFRLGEEVSRYRVTDICYKVPARYQISEQAFRFPERSVRAVFSICPAPEAQIIVRGDWLMHRGPSVRVGSHIQTSKHRSNKDKQISTGQGNGSEMQPQDDICLLLCRNNCLQNQFEPLIVISHG